MNHDYLLEQFQLIEEYLTRARSLAGHSIEDFLVDWMKIDAAVRGLTVLFGTSHNIAKHLIASHGWSPAQTKAEAFEILERHGVLPLDLADALREASRFRNLVTYQTTVVSNDAVYDILTARLGDFEQFAAQVVHWIEQNRKGGIESE